MNDYIENGKYMTFVNGKPRIVKSMFVGMNGSAHKFVGMKTRNIKGHDVRVAVFGKETDMRNPSAEEMMEYMTRRMNSAYMEINEE